MARNAIVTVTVHDCDMQTFRVGGHGGQKVDKTSAGVRLTHPPSGAKGESRESRYQGENKRLAFIKLVNSPDFEKWIKIETLRRLGAVEHKIDQDMSPENLLVEVKDEQGKWQKIG